MTSALGFKARINSFASCFITCVQQNPQIHLCCNTWWPLGSQHGIQTVSSMNLRIPVMSKDLNFVNTQSLLRVCAAGSKWGLICCCHLMFLALPFHLNSEKSLRTSSACRSRKPYLLRFIGCTRQRRHVGCQLHHQRAFTSHFIWGCLSHFNPHTCAQALVRLESRIKCAIDSQHVTDATDWTMSAQLLLFYQCI